jgi:hypothetical protein
MRWASLLIAGSVLCFVGCNQSTGVTGKSGKALELTFPKTVSITQGDTAEFKVEVDRDKVKEPVEIEFMALPEGVSLVEDKREIPKDMKEFTFHLKATPEAPPKEGHAAKIKGSAGELTAGPKEFTVDIKAKD